MSDTESKYKGLNILCIDGGGGVRGLSSLLLIQEIMRRVQGLEGNDIPVSPCKYFDVIGGTGFGALQACMLGRLELCVDRAIEIYAKLSTDIFSDKKWFTSAGSGLFKSSKLKESIMRIVEEATGDKDTRMIGNSSCKTLAFAMLKHNMNTLTPGVFRSYQVHANPGPDCTIWEAASACMAHPELFKSVEIGEPPLVESFIDGGLGCNNPLERVLSEVKALYPDRHVASIISIGAGHTRTIQIREIRPTMGPFRRILPTDINSVMTGIATESERVAEGMATRFHNIKNVYFRFNVQHGAQNIGLDEWKKLSEIHAHTRAYINNAEAQQKLENASHAIKMRRPVVASSLIDGQIPNNSTRLSVAERSLAPTPTPVNLYIPPTTRLLPAGRFKLDDLGDAMATLEALRLVMKVPGSESDYELHTQFTLKRYNLKVWISPEDREFLGRYQRNPSSYVGGTLESGIGYTITPTQDTADIALELHHTGIGANAVFYWCNPFFTKHGVKIVKHKVPARLDDVENVLFAASKWMWHLRHGNNQGQLPEQVTINLLKIASKLGGYFQHIYFSHIDGHSPTHLKEFEPIPLNDVGVVNLNVKSSPKQFYAFKVNNRFHRPLYVRVFYFDATNFSIGDLFGYRKACFNSTPDIPPGGSLVIGNRGRGGPPIRFTIRPDNRAELGYVKVFWSTEALHLDYIGQGSAFETCSTGREINEAITGQNSPSGEWGTACLTLRLTSH
ncbi:unnamed protein product [Rhizoctonia solani]|uniref:PNPLA domain-containing protein n=1 Tax=Rhizoctonia solani TaxID=456999 RepID=A0A8H2WQQ7_9AGAM|nr:unnamed protein product [Rhizoctonia solani]